jgi:hypothetical protein
LEKDWFAAADLLIRHYLGDQAAAAEDWDQWLEHAAQALGRQRLESEAVRIGVIRAVEQIFKSR